MEKARWTKICILYYLFKKRSEHEYIYLFIRKNEKVRLLISWEKEEDRVERARMETGFL